ncbi:MAG: hypothetical protein QOI21_2184 [Actinomycetota bacterium]|jgi:hypothetical protein|nr:hypothetical protein [Actinomycetota bacterium]
MWHGGRRWSSGWVVGTAVLAVSAVVFGVVGYRFLTGGHPSGSVAVYVDIAQAPAAPVPPPVLPGASTGTWRSQCGRNELGIRNSDNVVASPGLPGQAHHVHDYVGNVSTNAFSTDETLAAAATTCQDDDRSTYYWPVLRVPDGTGDVVSPHDVADGNHGRILVPDAVLLEFRGSPVGNVISMPEFLRASTGNAHGYSSGGVNTEHVQWTCSGTRDKVLITYPRCDGGQRTIRILDFPSCWNGLTIDSANHRTHIVFPNSLGACPGGTFPVPQLHMELSYRVPSDVDYTIDTFPEDRHSALADHGDFINVMPESLMSTVVGCLNTGRAC